MDYIILCTESKKLIQTSPLVLYKGERNFDTFKFLFPNKYANMTPLIKMIFANGTSKEFQCDFSNIDYKEKKVIELQISEDMLLTDGKIQIWATLYDDQSLLKTSITNIPVLKHHNVDLAAAIIGKAVLGTLVLGRR